MPKKQTPTEATPKRKVGTNSQKLPFPQDRLGATQELRRGGVRAIGRIMGDDKALAMVLETLDVLRDYANERYEEQKVELERKKQAARERAVAEKAAQREAALNAAKAAKVQAERSQAEYERITAELEG